MKWVKKMWNQLGAYSQLMLILFVVQFIVFFGLGRVFTMLLKLVKYWLVQ